MQESRKKTIADKNKEAQRRIEDDEKWLRDNKEYVDEIRNEKIEKEQWLESRKEWIENFPYEKKHHPTIFFSLEAFELPDIQLQQPNFVDYMDAARNDGVKTLFEFGDMADAYNEAMQQYRSEYEAAMFPAVKARGMVANHSKLKTFYDGKLRFTEEFEMVYDIINEYGYADNTILVIEAFDDLLVHSQALLRDPNEIWNNEGVTWGERAESTKQYMMAALYGSKYSFLHGEQRPSREEAEEMSFRIFNEIPIDNFANMGRGFPVIAEHRSQLKDGDPLIYR